MASIGEVSSNKVDKEDRNEKSDLPKKFYFGIFFDGTSNNMIQKERAKAVRKRINKQGEKSGQAQGDDTMKAYKEELQLSDNGANPIDEDKNAPSDFSNVAALHNMYIALSKEERDEMEKNYRVFIYNLYIHGAGTLEDNGVDLNPKSWFDKAESGLLGGGYGRGSSGVIGLVGNAMDLVQQRIGGYDIQNDDEIIFDVVGFSRGSACARMFAHTVRGLKDLACRNSFPERVKGDKFLAKFPAEKRKVRFLGIYDTVSSINVNYDNNLTEYGLYSPTDEWVEHTVHITAADEYRDHFRLTDVGDAVRDNAIELLIPGCHSDVGGGYKSGTSTMRLMYSAMRNTTKAALMAANALLPNHPLSTAINHGDSDRQIFTFALSPKRGAITRPIGIEWLEEIGWYSSTRHGYSYEKDDINNFYNITRNVDRGYSNIPLRIMLTKGNELTGAKIFDTDQNLSPLSRFLVIPDGLEKINSEINKMVGGKTNGRFMYIPPLAEYRKLRSRYIHFSSSNAIIGKKIKSDATLVHGPTIADDGCITRWVYNGNKGSTNKYDLRNFENRS